MTALGRRRGGMVRGYAATGGRAVPSRRSLDEATLLIVNAGRSTDGLDSQQQRVMALCEPGAIAVAEVASFMELPVSVVAVIVCALADTGHLITRSPIPAAGKSDIHVLERILESLHKL